MKKTIIGSLAFLFILSFIPSQIMGEEPVIFPEIKAWQFGDIKTWDADNLYQPIDGAADMFLAYQFREMLAGEYSKDGEYIRVEVYRHATTIDAFGAYSQERPAKDIYVNIGLQGYGEDDYLNFLAGNFYVKIRASVATDSVREVMLQIAGEMARPMNVDAVFPVLFEVFPREERISFAERFIRENLLGFPFFHSAYEVSYHDSNGTYILFIMAGLDEKDAQNMLTEYHKFLKLPTDDPADGFYSIEDNYTGHMYLLKSGKYLLGARGTIEEEKSRSLLKIIQTELEQD